MTSSKILALAVVLIVVLSCGAGAALALTNQNDDGNDNSLNSKVYNITYVLGHDDAKNSSENPTSYMSGETYTLYDATLDNMIFSYWCLDEKLTEECFSITEDMTGDITLYAKWSDSIAGKGLTFTVSGIVQESLFNSYTYTGTTTYKYVYYDAEKDSYFVQYSYKYNITYAFGGSTTSSDEHSYWSDDSSSVEQLDNQTIDTVYGEKDCEVYQYTDSDGSVQTQWIADGWIIYKITDVTEGLFRSTTWTYVLEEQFSFTTEDEYEATAYADAGITVTGSGMYSPGQPVTLTANASSGTTFKGWYDANGDLLSSKTTYETTAIADIVAYALNTDDPDTMYDSEVEIELSTEMDFTSATWKIVKEDTEKTVELIGTSVTYTFDEAGEYEIYIIGEIDGTTYFMYYTAMVTGDIARTFVWEMDGNEYTYTLNIDYADLQYYRDLYSVDERKQYTANNHAHDKTFVIVDDYIETIADDFEDMTEGMSQIQIANFILTFTQYIEYQDDSTYMGYDEYWKFPVETLFDMGGDCEDTSILYCAIADAMGFKTAMLLFTGHMAAGIYVAGFSGEGYTVGSVKYFYCETTTTGYDVGEVPNSMRNSRATVVTVN